MVKKFIEKNCLSLLYPFTFKELKIIFPNIVELTKEEFLLLNTPPLCYKKKKRHQELLRIIYKKTHSLK